MPSRWTVQLTTGAVEDKYKIPRGEAARLSDALMVLYEGPQPAGYMPYGGLLNVFEYTRNGYRIVYEVFAAERLIRVLFFTPVSLVPLN